MEKTSNIDREKQNRHDLIFGSSGNTFRLGNAEKIAHAVRDLDRKFEEQMVAMKAKSLHQQYFNLFAFPLDQEALTLIPRSKSEEARAVAFYRDHNHMKVGFSDAANPHLQEYMDQIKHMGYEVDSYLISESSLAQALDKYTGIKEIRPQYEEVKIGGNLPQALARLKEVEGQGQEIKHVSATEMMSILLTSAVNMRSSDIHLQPEMNHVSVRFRIDGVLQEVAKFHSAVYRSLINRIKILSHLKINITKTPQDGSFSIDSAGQRYEIRVSFLPSSYGEAVVMRILGTLVALDMKELGLRHLAYEVVQREIAKPNGLILTTGPTGSGKTTTLYAFLKLANKPGVKIIALENPVEYRLEGIEQIGIDERSGLTFANALRSVLRQDPDIVMVGEIRDFDTADIASQASLTGHMVYSTLHTNDAAGAIPRLLNLGIKPVTLAPALSCIIAQRLVRRLCTSCRKEHELDASMVARVQHALSTIPPSSGAEVPKEMKFFQSPGCAECNYMGYRGRIGVFEVMALNDSMQKIIFADASTVQIKEQAVKSGMLTMLQDGLLKAAEGITDIAEVFRVTEE